MGTVRKVYFLWLMVFVTDSVLGQEYYRSANSGNWSTLSTWESSPDNLAWSAATSIPTSTANIITIRNGHTVTVTAAASADQLIIASGAILEHFSGIFTIEDGAGADIDIQNGGIFLLSSAATSPSFGTGSPTINVNTGGMLRVSASGLTGAGAGVNASNYVYQHQSILEWTLGAGFAFSTSNVTYFPNVDAVTIPIFRTTNPTAINVGANTATIINGVFECNGTNVIWVNTGIKTFRNGVKGPGMMDGSASGKFIINGITAELGGGTLVAPAAGLEIGTPTTVTMTSDKTITGNVSLLTDTYVVLGNNNLTVSGTVTNATITSYVKTNGTGKLTLLGVAAVPFGGKLFPIGLTTINPLYIFSATTANYSARIVEPITPPIFNNVEAVLRTWYITCSVTAPGATISFGYSYPGDCGGSYNNGGPVEVGVNIGGVWNIHQTGLVPVAFPIVPGTYIVTPTIPISYFNSPITEFPFVIANNGAILPLDYFIAARAQKRNNQADITWNIFETNGLLSFELQRSVNNGAFVTIGTIAPGTALAYSYTDAALGKGTNLYRIKVNRHSGAIKYSNTVAVINDTKGLLITSMAPNPVHDQAMLTVSAAGEGAVNFEVYDMTGSLVKQWSAAIAEGTNMITINTSELPAGTYQLWASTPEAQTGYRFVKQ